MHSKPRKDAVSFVKECQKVICPSTCPTENEGLSSSAIISSTMYNY